MQALEADALWQGTSMMGLPHVSTNLSQAAESPDDILDRPLHDPTDASIQNYVTPP